MIFTFETQKTRKIVIPPQGNFLSEDKYRSGYVRYFPWEYCNDKRKALVRALHVQYLNIERVVNPVDTLSDQTRPLRKHLIML